MWPTLFRLPLIGLPIRGYGLMLMIGFLGGTYWAARRADKVKADPDFVINLGFVSLIASVIGARIFYVLHYWERDFKGRGLWAVINVSAGGLEFYGGLIGAVAAGLVYVWLKRRSMRLYLDVVAPSIMFGMAMARIGCFLNGCCWGAPCPHQLPWAVRFPFGSPAFHRQWEGRLAAAPAELIYVNAQGIPFPLPREMLDMSPEEREGAEHAYRVVDGELAQAKTAGADSKTLAALTAKRDRAEEQRKQVASMMRPLTDQVRKFDRTPSELRELAEAPQSCSLPVHPAQLYASIDGMLLALLLNAYFYRRKRHGMVFALLLLLYPAVRVVEEIIRIDNPHDTAGLTISQFVSVLLLAGGLVFMYRLRHMPPRSPWAVACTPAPAEPQRKKSNKR